MNLREIRIFESNKYKYIGIYQDNELVQNFFEPTIEGGASEGNIHIGRIESIDKSGKNAFVNIGCDKNAILPLKKFEKVSKGEYVTCEIIRGEKGEKGAKVSLGYTVPGKYIVGKNGRKKISVSRSMSKDEIREELWNILKEYSRDFDGEILVRSNIKNCDDTEVLKGDLEESLNILREVKRKGQYWNKVGKIYDSGGMLGRVIRGEKEECTVVQSSYLTKINGKDRDEYITNKELEGLKIGDFISDVVNSYKRKVSLPEGGSMVIDRGEALYSIDINSGNVDKSIVNDKNAEFICREILKRNLNGMIIIDFVNFDRKDEIIALAEKISEKMNEDTVKSKVFFNRELGLVEIARNRKGVTLYEILDDIYESDLCSKREINKEESRELILGIIHNAAGAIEVQKNKNIPRLNIKLNTFFKGLFEKEFNQTKNKIFNKNVDLVISYNDEFVIGYKVF
ncbi:ribonuclease E/G [Oceanirhabdus sp. W0125-5]|uniref:ribonuclease E/G n=1 Tax=Oceanirhabdus sp. W0125-5 TaxID=2999116 RepID=UPI0022F2FE50|nr:ribonuclease E/G [Oceanirhabdus sp. W0125-5]WBW95848.1 ribonuclease E/G [Oceanirhabdus sp. W0125-5]